MFRGGTRGKHKHISALSDKAQRVLAAGQVPAALALELPGRSHSGENRTTGLRSREPLLPSEDQTPGARTQWGLRVSGSPLIVSLSVSLNF